MKKYILSKLIIGVLILFGVANITFFLLHIIPGDPADAIAGPQATSEDVENLRKSLGLDRPIWEQYISYMKNLLKGDLGYSYRNKMSALEMLKYYWPGTMLLTFSSMLIAVLIGVPVGILAATKRGTLIDTISMFSSFIGLSMPSFWLALVLIIIFGVKFPILPFWGREGFSSYILPSLTLSWGVAANIARMTRASMLEILSKEYIRTACGKGLSEKRVVYLHALRNAAVSIITIIGLQMGTLMGGQVVTETIFSWPGLGRMIVNALYGRDLQIVQIGILVLTLNFLILNLLTDICYGILDPRIRFD